MSKLDKQGLETLINEIDKSVNTKINATIGNIDLSTLATKEEVNDLKDTVETNSDTTNTTIDNLKSETALQLNNKLNKTGGQLEGIIKAQSNEEYEIAQMRNVILSTDDPDDSFGDNGDIWIKYE